MAAIFFIVRRLNFMYESITQCFVMYLEGFLPFAIVFGFGNLAVSVILRAAFGGRLIIK